MIIRKIRKNEIVSKKKIISWAIVIVVVLGGIKGMQYLFHVGNTLTPSRITNEQVGSVVHIKGYLSMDNNFPYYTHSLVDEVKDKIGLRSASVNLNNYSGNVEIIGKIEKFLKSTPVVEVDTIKLSDQGLIVRNNIYFFTKDFLYLDFSSQPQLSAMRSGNNVVILYENSPVVQLERFLCSKILKNKNCSVLINEYNISQKDTFQSLWGYPFYKHANGVWVAFDETMFGYLFKNIDDEMMLKLSNMIRIVNKDFILANKLPQIKKACTDSRESLQDVESMTITQGNGQVITSNIRGTSTLGATVHCTLTFDTWNEWAIKKATLSRPE